MISMVFNETKRQLCLCDSSLLLFVFLTEANGFIPRTSIPPASSILSPATTMAERHHRSGWIRPLNFYNVVGFTDDDTDGSFEENYFENKLLCRIILDTGRLEDENRAKRVLKQTQALSGVSADKLARHLYWIVLEGYEKSHFMYHYCGVFVKRLVEIHKLSHYTMLTTLWHVILPRLNGLNSADYSTGLRIIGRFLREVYYEEERSESSVRLCSKIEYLFCRWESSSLTESLEDPAECLKLKGLEQSPEEAVAADCYEDVLCALLDFTQGETLFPEVLKKLIGFRIVSFQTILELELARIVEASDYVKMDAITCSYSEIKSASKLLRIVVDVPKLHPDLFYFPWYIPPTSSTSIIKFRSAKELQKREILRINLYFLSRISRNLDVVLSDLKTVGVLDSEDVSYIEKYETPLEKGVALFTNLMVKDRDKLPLVINVMKETNNEETANILEADMALVENMRLRSCASSEASTPVEVPVASSSSLSPTKTKVVEDFRKDMWSCAHCTYDNFHDLSYCEQCCRSRFGDIEEQNVVYQCQKCTLINAPGASHCEVCENPLFDINDALGID